MEMLHSLAVTWCLNKAFEKSATLKLISALQISAVLDYGKVYFRRICKGIKINESCCYIWVVAVMVTVRQGFLAVTEAFTMVCYLTGCYFKCW